MNTLSGIRRGARSSASFLAIVGGAVLALGLSAGTVEAQGFGFGRAVAAGENGAVGRSRGVVSNGEGLAMRRGGFATDGQGNGVARQGGCIDGQSVAGCRGRAATWGDDGSFSGRAASEFTGDNGSFSGRRAIDRDADGNLTASRSADAAGANGTYSGAATLDQGIYNRDGTYTGTESQSATVEGTYERGVGGSRSVTCIDASGATVACP